MNDASEQPIDPEPSRLICHCMIVDEATIRRAIAAGADTLEAVQDATYASTGCGTCRYDVERLLDEGGLGSESP